MDKAEQPIDVSAIMYIIQAPVSTVALLQLASGRQQIGGQRRLESPS